MYQNRIYICISWYSNICWFLVKKYWCQQNSRGVSRDSYIFFNLLLVRHKCGKFHHCRICMTDFRERGPFCPSPPPPIREQPQKSPSWIGLNAYNLTKSGMWLINTLLFLRIESLCVESRITKSQKWHPAVLK